MMKKTLLLMFVIFVPFTPFALAASGVSSVDALIQGLGGDDEEARIEARQLLPREGIEAVPRLLLLLGHENAAVWWAAMRVLEDFANEVSAPGREAERAEVTRHLMTLVAPEQPAHMKERGLRLLPLVTPEGYDLAPIAALLEAPELREKARAALQQIGTDEAVSALCAALEKADPPFKAALLYSLARLEDPAACPAALKYTSHGDAHVRAAAAQALAWSGDPAYWQALWSVRAAADPATAFDATDALLRYAGAMALRGGNWNTAIGIYRNILMTDTDPVHRSGAIVGLGRFGDELAAYDIMASVNSPGGRELEAAALAAFERLQGAAGAAMLLSIYPNLSRDMQLGLLRVFGRKRTPVFLDLLNKTARSEDEAFRQAALEALVDSQLPGAMDGLTAIAQTPAFAGGRPEDRELVAGSLTRMAGFFSHTGDKEGAGKAYLELYRLADTDKERKAALEGIKSYPIPEAFDVVLNALEGEELDDLPVGVLAGIARAMISAGREKEGEELIDRLIPRLKTTQGVREAIQYLSDQGAGSEMAQRLGFVPTWWLVGPFDWKMDNAFSVINVDEPGVDLGKRYQVNGKELAWTRHTTEDPGGLVNLMGVVGAYEQVCAYALAKIRLDEAADGVVRCGSDDGIKVWVNGEAVHENNVDRGSDIDQDSAPAVFKAGENILLVEATQNAGGWNFRLRLTRPDGTVLPFTMVE